MPDAAGCGRTGLAGCRIGVRAYTTTTAVWIRALLADQCGVDSTPLEWITLDEGHVAGVPDPATVQRAAAGLRPADDAARRRSSTPPLSIGFPKTAAFVWSCRIQRRPIVRGSDRHGALTLNHVIVVRESLAERRARRCVSCSGSSGKAATWPARASIASQRRSGSRRTAAISRSPSPSASRRVCWRGRSPSTISSPTWPFSRHFEGPLT